MSRARDAEVAETVMGWTLDGSGWWMDGKKMMARSRPSQDFYACTEDDHVFSPTTEIAAAWTVVEKMRADGYTVILTAAADGNQQACRITVGSAAPFPVAELTLHPAYQSPSSVAQANTMPEAICTAALAQLAALGDGRTG